MTKIVSIVGYQENNKCSHCGRTLLNCIRLSDGRIVGASCLVKSMIKPAIHRGKLRKLSAKVAIQIAKIAESYRNSCCSIKFGIGNYPTSFELQD